MMDAPKRIWAYAGSFKMWRDHKTDQPHTQTEYHRADLSADLVRAGFLAGFNVSGEGWHGEYPFQDCGTDPETDKHFTQCREKAIAAIVARVTGGK